MLKYSVYPCIYNTVTLGKIQTILNMLRSVFSSERQTVATPRSLFVPLPPSNLQTLKKQLSWDLEFHHFDWLGLARSFSRPGLHQELTGQGGFYPLLPSLSPFH